MTDTEWEQELRRLAEPVSADHALQRAVLDGVGRGVRRRRVVVAVSASLAVVLVAGVGVTLTRAPGEERTARLPAALPTDPGFQGPWRVPSVLGMHADEAREALEVRGFRVVEERTGFIGCGLGDGDAASTIPEVGSEAGPGSEVVLRVAGDTPTSSGDADCFADFGTDLLRFARGLGPAPRLAETVTVSTWIGQVVLTREEAADPQAWLVCAGDVCRRPLAGLVGAFESRTGRSPVVSTVMHPELAKEWRPACGRSHPKSEPPLVMGAVDPEDGRPVCGVLDVYRDETGAIYAVELMAGGTIEPSLVPVPDVTGVEVDAAAEILVRAAFDTVVADPVACSVSGVVAATDPPETAPPSSTITLVPCR